MFPTTVHCIGKTERGISNLYNLESAMTKGILGFLSKKPQGPTTKGSSSKKEAIPKAAHVGETSNLLLQEP
jgi:hypothetical protein